MAVNVGRFLEFQVIHVQQTSIVDDGAESNSDTFLHPTLKTNDTSLLQSKHDFSMHITPRNVNISETMKSRSHENSM